MTRTHAYLLIAGAALAALLWWLFGPEAAVAPVAIGAGLRMTRRKAAALGDDLADASAEHARTDAAVDADLADARAAIVRAESAQPPADDL
jgi:hypothetical protein